MTTLAPTTIVTTVAPTTTPPDWWEVSSFHIHVGAIDSGNIADTRTIDSNYLVLDEIAGGYPAGGFQYHFIFTGIPGSVTFIRAIMEGRYDGHVGHDVRVYAFNYTLASWVELDQLVTSGVDQSYAWADLDVADYVSGGVDRIEYLHLSNGPFAKDVFIDQLIL